MASSSSSTKQHSQGGSSTQSGSSTTGSSSSQTQGSSQSWGGGTSHTETNTQSGSHTESNTWGGSHATTTGSSKGGSNSSTAGSSVGGSSTSSAGSSLGGSTTAQNGYSYAAGEVDPYTAAQRNAAMGNYQQSQLVSDTYGRLQDTINNRPGAFSSQYENQLNNLYNQILNRQGFSYDFNADPMYQMYKDQYTREGRRAMSDTIARASALSGGYGNSYAGSVGQQAYQNYLTQLNNMIPELRQQAYEEYEREGDRLNQLYSMAGDMYDRDYQRYRGEVSDWQADRSYDDSAYRDERNFDYSRYGDDRNFWNQEYWNERNSAQASRSLADSSNWSNSISQSDSNNWNRSQSDTASTNWSQNQSETNSQNWSHTTSDTEGWSHSSSDTTSTNWSNTLSNSATVGNTAQNTSSWSNSSNWSDSSSNTSGWSSDPASSGSKAVNSQAGGLTGGWYEYSDNNRGEYKVDDARRNQIYRRLTNMGALVNEGENKGKPVVSNKSVKTQQQDYLIRMLKNGTIGEGDAVYIANQLGWEWQ